MPCIECADEFRLHSKYGRLHFLGIVRKCLLLRLCLYRRPIYSVMCTFKRQELDQKSNSSTSEIWSRVRVCIVMFDVRQHLYGDFRLWRHTHTLIQLSSSVRLVGVAIQCLRKMLLGTSSHFCHLSSHSDRSILFTRLLLDAIWKYLLTMFTQFEQLNETEVTHNNIRWQ